MQHKHYIQILPTLKTLRNSRFFSLFILDLMQIKSYAEVDIDITDTYIKNIS